MTDAELNPVAGEAAHNGAQSEAHNGAQSEFAHNSAQPEGQLDGDQRSKIQNEYVGLPETDDPVKIREQVEFYFSNQNLATDRHMFLEMHGPSNHPVSIKHIHTFKRMQRYQPYQAVVAALRGSHLLQVVDDGEFAGLGREAVRRKTPISSQEYANIREKMTSQEMFERGIFRQPDSLDKSIYAKGFGDENAGQIDIENLFKPYGAIMVRKRRDDNNKWKGSVFVEFDSPDSQQQFLALDPKPKFNDNELTILSKRAYSEMKCKEKGITPAWERISGQGGGNYRGGRGGRGGRSGRGRGGYNNRGNHYSSGRNLDRYRPDTRPRSPDRRRGRDRSYARSRSPDGRRGRGRSYTRSPSPDGRRGYDRNESRSPKHSADSRDWNTRRDKFQKSEEFNFKGEHHGGSGKHKRKGEDIKPDNSPKRFKVVLNVNESGECKDEDMKCDDTSKRSEVEIKEDA